MGLFMANERTSKMGSIEDQIQIWMTLKKNLFVGFLLVYRKVKEEER